MQNWLNVVLLFVDPNDCTLEELINENPNIPSTIWWRQELFHANKYVHLSSALLL